MQYDITKTINSSFWVCKLDGLADYGAIKKAAQNVIDNGNMNALEQFLASLNEIINEQNKLTNSESAQQNAVLKCIDISKGTTTT